MLTDNLIKQNTAAWRFQVWAAFAIAFASLLIGICYLEADMWVKGFLGTGVIFTVSAAFTLSKTIRDDHEAERMVNRISSAKTEKILTEYE